MSLQGLCRKMLKKMKKQPLLFVELLFWKTRRECHYINVEYLLSELGHLKKESANWNNTQGDEEIGSSPTKVWTQDIKNYLWDGLNCTYPGNDSPTITTLNLSASGLSRKIDPSILNLTMLENL
ncbi:hypothetical protein JHK87_006978 [Glycine soja]|nr:hypothetical protein JHK87_006978 [Glycine soja]